MIEHLEPLKLNPDARLSPLTVTYRIDIVITKEQSQGLVFHYELKYGNKLYTRIFYLFFFLFNNCFSNFQI